MPRNTRRYTVRDNGSYVSVSLSARYVSDFADMWPYSGLPSRAIRFEFDKRNGDLVATNAPRHADGNALVALSQDAWKLTTTAAR